MQMHTIHESSYREKKLRNGDSKANTKIDSK